METVAGTEAAASRGEYGKSVCRAGVRWRI